MYPAWSPDGTRITVSSDRAETGNLDVYVMNADGSNQTKILTNGSAAYVCGDSTNVLHAAVVQEPGRVWPS